MTGLNSWLEQATRHLSKDSAAQVRSEIWEHYESAREAGVEETAALNALGDPKTANRRYRKVLLTSAEAKLMRDLNWETQAVCSRPWLKWVGLALPLAAASALFFMGRGEAARDVLIAGFGMSPLLAAPLLPIYTPARGRIFRVVKWTALAIAFVLVLGPLTLKWSWLLFSCMWPMGWTEWTRASIRRKLPAAAWPKHLYL